MVEEKKNPSKKMGKGEYPIIDLLALPIGKRHIGSANKATVAYSL